MKITQPTPREMICFTELETDRVCIISARRATGQELHDYEENVKN